MTAHLLIGALVLFLLSSLIDGATRFKHKHHRVAEQVEDTVLPPGKKDSISPFAWKSCDKIIPQLECVAPTCKWDTVQKKCGDPPTCADTTETLCLTGKVEYCYWQKMHTDKRKDSTEGFCVPKARRYTDIRVVNFPVFTGCSWGGWFLNLYAGKWPSLDPGKAKEEWNFAQRSDSWYEICRKKGATVQNMIDEWKAQLVFGIKSLGADARDGSILKIMVWPEWNFRKHPKDAPLTFAEAVDIRKGITEAIQKALPDETVAKDFYIIPGTIYFGEELKFLGNPVSYAPLACGLNPSAGYDVSPSTCSERWAMWNCMDEYLGGESIEFHCKANECENKDVDETWGRCAVDDPNFELQTHKSFWDFAGSFLGTKQAKQDETRERLFYTAQVSTIGGVTTGADICLDHITNNLLKATTPYLDSDLRTLAEHDLVAFAVDIQIIIANGMGITTHNSAMPNMKVVNEGYVIRCDGQWFEGGELKKVALGGTGVMTLADVELVLQMDSANKKYVVDLDAFNGQPVGKAIADFALTKNLDYWYPIFTDEVPWALVSAKLPLNLAAR